MECLLKKRKLELLNEIKEIDGLIKFQEMFDTIPVDVWFSIFKHLDCNLMLFRVSWTCSKWRHTVQKFNMIKKSQLIIDELNRLEIDINSKLPHYIYSAVTREYLIFHMIKTEVLKIDNIQKALNVENVDFKQNGEYFEDLKYYQSFINILNVKLEYKLRINKSDILAGITSFKAVPKNLKNLIVVFKFRNLEYEHRVVLH